MLFFWFFVPFFLLNSEQWHAEYSLDTKVSAVHIFLAVWLEGTNIELHWRRNWVFFPLGSRAIAWFYLEKTLVVLNQACSNKIFVFRNITTYITVFTTGPSNDDWNGTQPVPHISQLTVFKSHTRITEGHLHKGFYLFCTLRPHSVKLTMFCLVTYCMFICDYRMREGSPMCATIMFILVVNSDKVFVLTCLIC